MSDNIKYASQYLKRERDEAERLAEAKSIIEEYSKPCSMIDNGNLFFAATVYQEAFANERERSKKLAEALRGCGRHGCGAPHYETILICKTCRREALAAHAESKAR